MFKKEDIEKMTIRQLEEEYNAVCEQLEICFGTNDLQTQRMLEAEIEKRGLEIVEMPNYKLVEAE